jgi:GT2 family glycosyltransferase
MNPEVLVVVVNWNGRADLKACLESVAASDYDQAKMNVVVIDNGSRDGSETFVARLFPCYTLIRNPDNVGYAEAENQAVRICLDRGAEFLWILNNDVRVAEDALSKLIRAARRDETIAVLSPVIYDYLDVGKIDNAGYKISLWSGRFRKVLLVDEVTEVDSVQGCAALMRVSIFASIGRFPDGFKAYFEESDLHLRAKKAGWKVVTVAEARAWHKKAASFSRVPMKRVFYLLRNLVLLEFRNARFAELCVFVPYYVLVHLPVFFLKGIFFLGRNIGRRLRA